MSIYRRLRSALARPAKRVLDIVYPGRLCCPVCGARVRHFAPISDSLLEPKRRHGWPYAIEDAETFNARAYTCPHCDATDRERLYALFLRGRFEMSAAPVRMLDIAPAKPLRKFIARFPHVEHCTGDLMRKDVAFPGLDVTDMSRFAEGSFDAAICSHVLEHVPEDRLAMRELFRVLKPGGWAILMVPINLKAAAIDEDTSAIEAGERWRRFGQDDHVRLYTKAGFVERLSGAGFHVRQLGVEHFGTDVFQRSGITPQSVLHLSEKPAASA